MYKELVQVATVAWRIVRDLGIEQYRNMHHGTN